MGVRALSLVYASIPLVKNAVRIERIAAVMRSACSWRLLLPENTAEPEIFVVGSEYPPAIIAASDDVIESSADFGRWFPGHMDESSYED